MTEDSVVVPENIQNAGDEFSNQLGDKQVSEENDTTPDLFTGELELEIIEISKDTLAPGEDVDVTFSYDPETNPIAPGLTVYDAVEYAQDRGAIGIDRLLSSSYDDYTIYWNGASGGQETHTLSYDQLTTDDNGNEHNDNSINLYVQTTSSFEDQSDLKGESDPVEIEFVGNPTATLGLWPDPTDRHAHTGEEIYFDAYDSSAGEDDGYITEMKMDLNDDGEWDKTTSGTSGISHSFDEPGFYDVTLKIVDNNGKTDTTERLVGVNAAPEAAFEYAPGNPKMEPDEYGTPVAFDASDSDPGNSAIDEIIEYEWWFSASGHQFDETGEEVEADLWPGEYDVTLTVTDDDYETHSVTKTVTVEELDSASFAVDVIDTNSPVEAGEQLTVTTEIENTGDISATQTIEANVDSLGSDSTSVSLDGSATTTETFTISTTSGDADSYSLTISSNENSENTDIEVEQKKEELSVASTPDNVDVYLNNEYVGTTPWSEDRPVTESYDIEVDKDGYKSESESSVSPGTNLDFDLDPETDTIEVTSDPSGGEVYIDDEFVGTTTVTEELAVTGTYDVRVEFDEYEAVTFDAVEPPSELHADPDAEMEELTVTSTPDAADVYIDGEYVGTTPWSDDRPVTESYDIEVDKDGYESATRTDVSPSETIDLELAEQTGDGTIASIQHPATVAPDGSFTVEIETTMSAGTIAEFDVSGFDVALSSDDAVGIDETQVEFVDPVEGDSTYTIDVDISGGDPGDAGALSVWVNAEAQADADDSSMSTFELSGSHDSGVDQVVWETVTDQSDPTDELTFQDLVEAIQAYQDDGTLSGVDLGFQDLIDLIQWYQAEDPENAQDAGETTVTNSDSDQVSAEAISTDEDGEVTTLNHPDTVAADGEFEITVDTVASAGTVVELDTDAAAVDLSSEDAVQITGNRVEFLDVNAGDSTYTITVNVTDVEDGETLDIAAWVNAEDRADANDEATGTVTVGDQSGSGEITLKHPDTVPADDEFKITVDTVASAGTVVKLDPGAAAVDISSADAVQITDNRVEFLDVNAGNSTYTITVDVTDAEDGDVINITAWVNAENRVDADDEATGTVTVEPVDVEPGGNLTGTVTDTDTTPLVGTTVAVIADEETMATTTTDENGEYVFTNISPGTYEIQATNAGYESTSASATVEAGMTSQVSLVLPAESDDPSVSDYADDQGVVTAQGLQNAFADWQSGDIGAPLLQQAFSAWQSGEPVV